MEAFHDGSPRFTRHWLQTALFAGRSSTAFVRSRNFGLGIDTQWNTACSDFAEPMNDGFATTRPSLSAAVGDVR